MVRCSAWRSGQYLEVWARENPLPQQATQARHKTSCRSSATTEPVCSPSVHPECVDTCSARRDEVLQATTRRGAQCPKPHRAAAGRFGVAGAPEQHSDDHQTTGLSQQHGGEWAVPGWWGGRRPPAPPPSPLAGALPIYIDCCHCPCRSPTSAPSSKSQGQRAPAQSWCSSRRQPPP